MAEHKPLYRWSFNEAVRLNETDQWRASWHESIACRDFIDQSIAQNYDGHRLGGNVAGDAIAKFGCDRVNFLLANTIRLKDHDGRFSAANKEWAKGFFFEADDIHRHDWVIDQSHPGLVDLVTSDARRAYEQLHLFDAKQCASVFDFESVAGHVLVLRPEMLKDEYKTPECQLFKAERGFGCVPTASGRAIFGEFLIDGEKARYNRQDFLGVLKAEHLPTWVIEKMAAPEQEPAQAQEPTRIRVFQINLDRDTQVQRFEALVLGQAIDPSIYDEVYSGPVPDTDPEAIFEQFNTNPPPLHRGRSMSTSDVVEVGGKYLFVDRIGFQEVAFDASLTQKPEGLHRVVVIEPGLPAYTGEIGPDLKSMQRAVGGHIEVTCPFNDAVAVVGNDEAKLINMEGNRHIAGQVYAGPLLIIGDDGEGGFCSLTDGQAAEYCQQFAVPEEITMEEVQADMGMEFHAW